MPGDSTSLFRRILALPRPAWVICIGMFVNKFGNFLNVFLMLYLTAEGYSTFLAGLALGAIGLGSFFGNAVGGTLADKVGRRWAIVLSMFGTAGFTLIVPVLPDIYSTIAVCLVIGFFGQLYRPAGGAILVDTVDEGERIAAFGLLRLAINLGMSVGPLVGGILSNVSYTYLFVGNAVTSFLFGLLVLVLLPETLPQPHEDGEDGAAAKVPDRGYRDVFADPAMRLYILSMIAATYVYTQTTATLPLQVRDSGLSATFYGLLLGINAFVIVLVELPLVKYTESRDFRRVIALGLALLAVGVGASGLAADKAMLIVTVLLWTFGEMIYTPVATSLPGLFSPPHLRGRYQATEGIAITVAQTGGPALGGFLYGHSAGLHWGSCVVLALVGAGLILAIKQRGNSDTAQAQPALQKVAEADTGAA
ncbi:MDR family MFS transporter [Streptomyces sp.]|uniref:MDR family MFS transporter n=1 Tax=Streptomyces sp. TaxID=1931 RepID=UPI002F4187D4